MGGKIIVYILYLILSLIFLGGGLWTGIAKNPLFIEIEGVIFSLTLLALAFIKNKIIVFPKGSLFLLIFCLIQIPFLIFSRSGYSVNFFLLFLGGTFFLISFYNLGEYFRGSFGNIVIITAAILGVIYLVSRYIYDPFNFMNTWLFITDPKYLHIHLGDLFAVIFIMSLYRLLKQKKRIYLIILAASTFFIATSFSRSAVVSLAAGLFYLFFFNNDFSKYKKKAIILFIFAVVVFLFEGAFKPIFEQRVYYYQAIYIFISHPLGIGMGNFSYLFDYGLGNSVNTPYTHSLPLEVLIGAGVWGFPFFVWLYKVIKDVFFVQGDNGLIYRLMALVLVVNFTFDTTYVIPVMFWILFASLGLAQSCKVRPVIV